MFDKRQKRNKRFSSFPFTSSLLFVAPSQDYPAFF